MIDKIILLIISSLLFFSCSNRKIIGQEYKVNKTIDEYGIKVDTTFIVVRMKEKGFNIHPTIESYTIKILSIDSLKIKNRIGFTNNFQVYYEWSNISSWLYERKIISKGYFRIKNHDKEYFFVRFNIPKQKDIPAFRKRIKVLKN